MMAIILCSSFANAVETHSTDCELSLQQVLENRTDCVREIVGDKIYIKKENIYISEKGICLMLNEFGDFAFIPVLCTDSAGCFIQFGLTSGSDYRISDVANNYKKICSDCGSSYFTSCHNKDCIRNKKN